MAASAASLKRIVAWGAAILALAAAIVPAAMGMLGNYPLYVLSLVAIYGLSTTGLTLFMGYAGQLSLCQAAFYGVGAYVAASLTKAGQPLLLAVLAGGVAAGLLGGVIGVVTVRLRGFYLAIITLACGLIAFQVFKNFDAFTGGVSGIGRIPAPSLAGFRLGPQNYYFFNLAFLLAGILLAGLIVRSPTGRAMRAIASNELASRSLGIASFRIKAAIFALAAGFSGIGGGLYAHLARFITPDDFGLMFSIQFITMAIVGGLQSVLGGAVGALVITVAAEQLRSFPSAQPILYGLVLIVLVRFMPAGVAGSISLVVGRMIAAVSARRGRPALHTGPAT